MELSFRLAEPEDLPDIVQLQSLSLRMLHPPQTNPDVLAALIEHQKRERERADELIILMVCNHQLLGFIALLPLAGRISGLFVHPDFVRQQIGSALLSEAIAILGMRHHRGITVLSSEYAKNFYKHHGFRLLESRALGVDRHHKVRVFLMSKELRPLTPAEQQQRGIMLGILFILIFLSVWAAIA